MARHALRLPSDRVRKAVDVRHDSEHGFIRDVIAEKNRIASGERRMSHQFTHGRRFGKALVLDLDHEFSREHLDRRVDLDPPEAGRADE